MGDVEDLTREENAELQSLLQRSVRALREESAPHGFNIGHEPRLGGRRRHPRITSTGTWCPAGAATPTSCRWWGRRGCFPNSSRRRRDASRRGSPRERARRRAPRRRAALVRGRGRRPRGHVPASRALGCAHLGPGVRALRRGRVPDRPLRRSRVRALVAPRRTPFAHHRDLIAVLDAAGVGRTALVGCSMGGGIAIDATLEYPGSRVGARGGRLRRRGRRAAAGGGGVVGAGHGGHRRGDRGGRPGARSGPAPGDLGAARDQDEAGARIRAIAFDNLQDLTVDEARRGGTRSAGVRAARGDRRTDPGRPGRRTTPPYLERMGRLIGSPGSPAPAWS